MQAFLILLQVASAMKVGRAFETPEGLVTTGWHNEFLNSTNKEDKHDLAKLSTITENLIDQNLDNIDWRNIKSAEEPPESWIYHLFRSRPWALAFSVGIIMTMIVGTFFGVQILAKKATTELVRREMARKEAIKENERLRSSQESFGV